MSVRLQIYTFGNGTKTIFEGKSLKYAERKAVKLAAEKYTTVLVEVWGPCGWDLYKKIVR